MTEEMELEFHPVSELFPLIEGAEFEELKADIKERGLLEKITLHPDGSILDGRNRYRACKELGIDFETTTWKGNGDPTSFVISRNVLRRHLSPGQRACIAVEAVRLRKRLGGKPHTGLYLNTKRKNIRMKNLNQSQELKAFYSDFPGR
jgi:hypothetical protein